MDNLKNILRMRGGVDNNMHGIADTNGRVGLPGQTLVIKRPE